MSNLSVRSKIFVIRGRRVMIDIHLGEIFDVETKRLNEQVKRNRSRFPIDFMFQLSQKEWENLRSQFATAKQVSKSRTLPFVFTEHGMVMLANVLKSQTAIDASVQIVRAFVQMRETLAENESILKRMEVIEKKIINQDKNFAQVFAALKELYGYSEKQRKQQIGF